MVCDRISDEVPPTTGLSILVVEDDDAVRQLLAEILTSLGYVPIEARHGQEALERLHAGLRPALILLDLMMPIMDGRAFRTAQRHDPALAAIPVVIVSAVAEETDLRGLDPVAVLPKPLGIGALCRVLDEHVCCAT